MAAEETAVAAEEEKAADAVEAREAEEAAAKVEEDVSAEAAGGAEAVCVHALGHFPHPMTRLQLVRRRLLQRCSSSQSNAPTVCQLLSTRPFH